MSQLSLHRVLNGSTRKSFSVSRTTNALHSAVTNLDYSNRAISSFSSFANRSSSFAFIHRRRNLSKSVPTVPFRTVVNRTTVLSSSSSSLLSPFQTYQPAEHSAFDRIQSEFIVEHNAVATLYRHKVTGAELLSIVCPEEIEKTFGIAFKTPPTDDTGIAHILEHSVLCGSRKYPSKEPFVELLKSSLQTYLNAMTYPDRTVYPVASPNTTDFYNLVHVYLDAVLYPNLARWTLAQEGWHLEIDGDGEEGNKGTSNNSSNDNDNNSTSLSPIPSSSSSSSSSLLYRGVVYNEMKGVYSNPDNLHAQAVEAALFPDTPYARSSGGDPLAIPALTYEKFQNFHKIHYHPSNARIWFFGDDPEYKRLEIIAEYLHSFKEKASTEILQASNIPLQSPFSVPISISVPYPVTDNGSSSSTSSISENISNEDPTTITTSVDESLTKNVTNTAVSNSTNSKEDGDRLQYLHKVPLCVTGDTPVSTPETISTPTGVTDAHFVTVSWVLPLSSSTSTSTSSASSFPPSNTEQSHGYGDDEVTRLGLSVLNHLLMGTQASTLRKVLTDSAMGAAVIGGGYDDSLVQPTFSVGLKGVQGENVHQIEALITHTLTMIAGMGFEPDHITASLNTVEFSMREFATGGNPRGLSLLLGTLPAWIYNRNPIQELKYEKVLQELKERIQTNPVYFSDLIRSYFLVNNHKAVIHSYPDPLYEKRREQQEFTRLTTLHKQLTSEDIVNLQKATEQLQIQQSTPDTPEALATIPTLQVTDLPKENKQIVRKIHASSTSVSSSASVPSPVTLVHELPTSGIGYGKLVINLSSLPERLVPLLPLFTWCLTSTGTRTKDEVTLSRALGISTGGVAANVSVTDIPGHPSHALPLLSFSGKALSNGIKEMGELIYEMLATAKMDRMDRILHFYKESIARHESGIVSNGHRYANSILNVDVTKSAWINEVWSGITNLEISRLMYENLNPNGETNRDKNTGEQLMQDLEEIRSSIFRAATDGSVLVAVTGDQQILPSTMHTFQQIVQTLQQNNNGITGTTNPQMNASVSQPSMYGEQWTWTSSRSQRTDDYAVIGGVSIPLNPRTALEKYKSVTESTSYGMNNHEDNQPTAIGIVVPTQVNYVVKNGHAPLMSPPKNKETGTPGAFSSSSSSSTSLLSTRFPTTGSTEVIANYLRTGYLWETVRVQGGAYGGFVSITPSTGTVSFASYRDPNLRNTIDAYDNTLPYLSELRKSLKNSSSVQPDIFNKSVISSIGSIDAPLSPVEKGTTSTSRYLLGTTDAMLQERRHQILGTVHQSGEKLDEFIDMLDQSMKPKNTRIAVVGSPESFTTYAQQASNYGGGTTENGKKTINSSKTAPNFILYRPLQKK